MSMIRQVWLLILGIIVLACAGSLVVSIGTARAYLEAQLALKNNDNAQSLALTLSQQRGDRQLMELALAAQFDTGYYRLIRLRAPEGQTLVERAAPDRTPNAPAWFAEAVPVVSTPGVAQVSSGWNAVGTLEVISQPAFAYASLWQGAVRMGQWMLLLGLLAATIGWLAVRQWRRPLDAVVEQAAALTQRRFLTISEPAVPELRRVAQALNAMVERVRTMFAEQVDQVDQLRRLANCDTLTGVAHRRHFLSRLEDELPREGGSGRGLLVLMRIGALADANRALGHALTDGLLRQAAQALDAPGQADPPLVVGRLNGSDFAVLYEHGVDAGGVAAQVLGQAQDIFAPFEQAVIVASCVVWHRGDSVAGLLQVADAALARAELRGNGAFEVVGSVSAARAPGGEESWRRRLHQALAEDQLELAQFPLLDVQGRLIHHECPLRIRVDAAGRPEPAAVWLPYAVRTGLISRIDVAAASLALDRIELDGQPRGINIAPASLLDPAFVGLLRSLMEEHAEAAPRLCLEIDEAILGMPHGGLADLCHQLRSFGVRVGVEHAGEHAAQTQALLAIGLDFVKLRGSFVSGVASDEPQAVLVRGTVSALHGLGMKVYAEGVANPSDLTKLWQLGIDAATGAAVTQG
ncbi:MAG: LapD/MoxY N-terminal periplasmic domain-containing protein [Burkholderiales bacterium]